MNYTYFLQPENWKLMTEQEQKDLQRAIEAEAKAVYKENYSAYVEYVHEGRWLPGKHLLFICDEIEKLLSNKLKEDILIISMPPQHGKSNCVTETLPSWFLGKYPDKRVIEVSYGDDLARRFGRANKRKIEHFGKDIFNIELSTDSRSDTEFGIAKHQGSMISRGIMSGITGQPGDLIIIDDPIKNRQEADSETYRERMWEEWLNSINTRRSANCKVILIQTRWHEDDLAGRLIATMPDKCKVINLPCEAEENDILGRTKGDALFPEIGKDKVWLQEFKKSYQTQEGNRAWLALFQGRPTAAEGNMIKRYWFRYWKPKGIELPPVTVKDKDGNHINIYAEDLPDYIDESIQSWDCTFKKKEDSDYVCGGVLSRRLANYYLRDLINDRMGIVETMKSINTMTNKWPAATLKLVEDKANGSAVIEMLQDKIPGIVPVEPKGDKISRANAVSPCIESGNYYVPHPMIAPWVNKYIEQMCAFPHGKNDDMVDMTTQGLTRLINRTHDTKPVEPDPDNPTYEDKYQKMANDIMGGELNIRM